MDELTSSPSPKPLKWVLLLFPFFRDAENEAGDVREPVRSQKESSINKIRKEEKKEGRKGERGMGREEMCQDGSCTEHPEGLEKSDPGLW